MAHWMSSRVLVAILLAIGAATAVAIGVGGVSGAFTTGAVTDLGTMRLLGGVLLVAGLVGFVVRGPAMDGDDTRLAGAGMITLAAIMLAVFIAGMQPPRSAPDAPPPPPTSSPEMVRINPDAPEPESPPNLEQTSQTEGVTVVEEPEPPTLVTETQPDSPPPNDYGGFDWSILRLIGRIVLGLMVLLLILIALKSWGAARRSAEAEQPERPARRPGRSGPEAAEALRYAVRDSQGPARKIVDAYHHLTEELAAIGAPRRRFEAPHEHLDRALGPLGVPTAPLHRLADLYGAAQFSERTITEGDWEEARETLSEGLSLIPARADARGAAG